jgi:hypothetical protein
MDHRLTRILLIVMATTLWLYLSPPARFQATPARAQADQEAIQHAVEAVLFEGTPSDGRLSRELRSAALQLAGEVVGGIECRELSRIPKPNYRCGLDPQASSWPPREN